MYGKSMSLLVGKVLCAVLVLGVMGRPARAEAPETQTITFAVIFNVADPGALSD